MNETVALKSVEGMKSLKQRNSNKLAMGGHSSDLPNHNDPEQGKKSQFIAETANETPYKIQFKENELFGISSSEDETLTFECRKENELEGETSTKLSQRKEILQHTR